MAKRKKVVYYDDPLRDDFSRSTLKDRDLGGYRFLNTNPIFVFFSYLIYFLIAVPVLYLISKIFFGAKVVGKKKLKALKGKGAFFYGNHTQEADGFFVQAMLTRSRRTYILAGRAALSLKGLGWLLKMLGVIPIPKTPSEHLEFTKAIEYRHKRRDHIVIYPEAHIWPYYTGIRPFGEGSFVYPSKLLAPVVPICMTYRRRKIFKNGKPRITIHVGNIIYPDETLPIAERAKRLRDETYLYMRETAYSLDNYEYISYVRRSQPK